MEKTLIHNLSPIVKKNRIIHYSQASVRAIFQINSQQGLSSSVSPLLPTLCISLSKPEIKPIFSPKLNSSRQRLSRKLQVQAKTVQTTEAENLHEKILTPRISLRLEDMSSKKLKRTKKKKTTFEPQRRKWFDSSVIPSNYSGLQLDKLGKYFKRSSNRCRDAIKAA